MLSPDKTTVGRLMLAFGLTDNETSELINAVGAYYGFSFLNNFFKGRIPASFLDEETGQDPITGSFVVGKADYWGQKLVKEIYSPSIDFFNTFPLYCNVTLETNGESPVNYMQERIDIYGYYLDGVQEDTIKGFLSLLLSYSARDNCIMGKKDSILYLHECGYSLKRDDIKGLSPAIVEKIVQEAAKLSSGQPQDTSLSIEETLQSYDLSIIVPASLWTGKTPPTIRDGMRHKGFDDAVIAYVLFNWCDVTNKTQLGKFLSEKQLNDSSYNRLANKLLTTAERLNVTKGA